jgi:cell division protein ZapA (FtsZ GTPase activity inhibitor)
MSVLDITLLTTRLQFTAPSEEESKVRYVATMLNRRLEKLREGCYGVPDSMLFAMALMMMEEEIHGFREKIEALEQKGGADVVVAETMDAFRDYIHVLADKYMQALQQQPGA